MKNYVQQMLKTIIWGEFQAFVAILIPKVVPFCVIFGGVFNLRSKNKENRTQ
jgi:hypothetical protein